MKNVLPLTIICMTLLFNGCSSSQPLTYSKTDKVNFNSTNNTLKITLDKIHGLSKGDNIKIATKENTLYEKEVIEIISDNTFIISDWENPVDTIFVYGKKVDDFRAIDYDQIFTVGIGAIQELSKQNEEQQEIIEQQQKDILKLKEQNSKILKLLENIEQQ